MRRALFIRLLLLTLLLSLPMAGHALTQTDYVRSGAYTVRRIITDGLVTEEWYEDGQGHPVAGPGGCYGILRTYNELQQNTVVTFTDAEGQPMEITSGYASIHRAYNAANLISLETYHDLRGRPVTLAEGYAGIRMDYDHKISMTITYVNPEGQPVRTVWGYAIAFREYDEAGNQIRERYYDPAGKPVSRIDGYAGLERTWAGGRNPLVIYLGTDGQPVLNASGFAAILRDFDEDGRIIQETYFDENLQPVPLSLGQYGILRGYNDLGQNTEITYLGADGLPCRNSLGYARVIYTRDIAGNILEERYYGPDGAPAALDRGQYGLTRHGNKVSYLDIHGKPYFALDLFLTQEITFVTAAALLLCLLPFLLPRKARLGLLILYSLFILYMTLWVREAGDKRLELQLFWSYRDFLTNEITRRQILNNILLFIPFGCILFSLRPSPVWILLSLLFSSGIELSQYLFGLGVCELDDIVSNLLGGAAGWLAGFLLLRGQQVLHRIRSGHPT